MRSISSPTTSIPARTLVKSSRTSSSRKGAGEPNFAGEDSHVRHVHEDPADCLRRGRVEFDGDERGLGRERADHPSRAHPAASADLADETALNAVRISPAKSLPTSDVQEYSKRDLWARSEASRPTSAVPSTVIALLPTGLDARHTAVPFGMVAVRLGGVRETSQNRSSQDSPATHSGEQGPGPFQEG